MKKIMRGLIVLLMVLSILPIKTVEAAELKKENYIVCVDEKEYDDIIVYSQGEEKLVEVRKACGCDDDLTFKYKNNKITIKNKATGEKLVVKNGNKKYKHYKDGVKKTEKVKVKVQNIDGTLFIPLKMLNKITNINYKEKTIESAASTTLRGVVLQGVNEIDSSAVDYKHIMREKDYSDFAIKIDEDLMDNFILADITDGLYLTDNNSLGFRAAEGADAWKIEPSNGMVKITIYSNFFHDGAINGLAQDSLKGTMIKTIPNGAELFEILKHDYIETKNMSLYGKASVWYDYKNVKTKYEYESGKAAFYFK